VQCIRHRDEEREKSSRYQSELFVTGVLRPWVVKYSKENPTKSLHFNLSVLKTNVLQVRSLLSNMLQNESAVKTINSWSAFNYGKVLIVMVLVSSRA
jgi:hypothetical protein